MKNAQTDQLILWKCSNWLAPSIKNVQNDWLSWSKMLKCAFLIQMFKLIKTFDENTQTDEHSHWKMLKLLDSINEICSFDKNVKTDWQL